MLKCMYKLLISYTVHKISAALLLSRVLERSPPQVVCWSTAEIYQYLFSWPDKPLQGGVKLRFFLEALMRAFYPLVSN